MHIRAKDFIETAEGLIFAVLVDGPEDARFLCFLRYLRTASGLRKLPTEAANRLIAAEHPEYLFHSTERDAMLHGVREQNIVMHFQTIPRFRQIVDGAGLDPIETKLRSVVKVFEESGCPMDKVGVTGSLLIGAQNATSDIDLVVHDRDDFEGLRMSLGKAIANASLDVLSEAQWLESYERRSCSLSFDEYVWHEKRKYNKASFAGAKIDLSQAAMEQDRETRRWRKIRREQITAKVIDARDAFNHPARYVIAHAELREIASYTPTYAGQALSGEVVSASGIIEESDDGMRRLVLGSSREAPGEYIKLARYTR